MRYFIFISFVVGYCFWSTEVRSDTLFSIPKAELSPDGKKLVYDFEVGGGEKYYNRFLNHISWPGFQSGPTGGIGYDFAYSSPENIKKDWRKLPPNYLNRLVSASGKTGQAGKAKTQELKDILIQWGLAENVFNEVTVARYWQLCLRTWPGFENLEPNAQAALWSVTYNRGGSLAGPSREEMRNISRLTAKKDYLNMSIEIKKMKRLWANQNLGGLLARRDAESALMATCIK